MSAQREVTGTGPETLQSQTVQVNLHGRYMLPSRQEYSCEVVEMSTAEMLLSTPVQPATGEKIIVYITELGRFEGVVVRLEPAGFAMGMSLTELKHKKLAERLTWFANRDSLEAAENRRFDRIVPLMQRVALLLPNGEERVAKISDLSLTGVSIETNCRLLKGSNVVVGSRPATVVRLFDGGFVGEFVRPFEAGELDERTRL